MKNALLKFLSKNPIQMIVFLFLLLFQSTLLLSNSPTEMKVIYSVAYLAYLSWFFAGTFRKIIVYILTFLGIIVVTSVVTVSLENYSPTITAVFFPSILFNFFATQTVMEFFRDKDKQMKLSLFLPFANCMLNIITVFLVYTFFSGISKYFALVIAMVFVVIVLTYYYIKKLNKNN